MTRKACEEVPSRPVHDHWVGVVKRMVAEARPGEIGCLQVFKWLVGTAVVKTKER